MGKKLDIWRHREAAYKGCKATDKCVTALAKVKRSQRREGTIQRRAWSCGKRAQQERQVIAAYPDGSTFSCVDPRFKEPRGQVDLGVITKHRAKQRAK